VVAAIFIISSLPKALRKPLLFRRFLLVKKAFASLPDGPRGQGKFGLESRMRERGRPWKEKKGVPLGT